MQQTTLKCPSCGASTELLDERRARCGHCGTEVLLPERGLDGGRIIEAIDRTAAEVSLPRLYAECEAVARHGALCEASRGKGQLPAFLVPAAVFVGGVIVAMFVSGIVQERQGVQAAAVTAGVCLVLSVIVCVALGVVIFRRGAPERARLRDEVTKADRALAELDARIVAARRAVGH